MIKIRCWSSYLQNIVCVARGVGDEGFFGAAVTVSSGRCTFLVSVISVRRGIEAVGAHDVHFVSATVRAVVD
jgi:hypothetical protein